MKIAYIMLVVSALATCNKVQKMNEEFVNTISSFDSLTVSKIDYADSTHLSTFHPGFTTLATAGFSKEKINALVTAMRDTSNYYFEDARNCVMKPEYGIKIDEESKHFVVLFGKAPCLKVTVINRKDNSEKTIDLKDNNTILPIIEGLFKGKGM